MKTLKIFSDQPLGDSALQLLQSSVAPHEIIFSARPAASVLGKSPPDPRFAEADIAFGQPDADSVLQSTRLRWLQLASAGYTRYDNSGFRAAAASRGLLVTNSSMVYSPPSAEHVFAFMLAQSRRLVPALQSRFAHSSDEWHQLRASCRPLSGQKVVLLGYGTMAVRLVELLRPFNMQVTAFRRRARGDEAVSIVGREQLPSALAAADHLVNLLPENAETHHFVSASVLASLKPGAVFYNLGRGTTLDQAALLEVLQSGRLAAAWLDVTEPEPLPLDHPLLRLPNCHITPHIGGGHQNEAESLVRHFLDNFQRFLAGAPLHDRIM